MRDQPPADASIDNWVNQFLPTVCIPYARLARLDRPIGSWLLFWPCLWGVWLAQLETGLIPLSQTIYISALFALGAFVMRGAGCTYNDIVDRDYDGKVERSRNRPLPAGHHGGRSRQPTATRTTEPTPLACTLSSAIATARIRFVRPCASAPSSREAVLLGVLLSSMCLTTVLTMTTGELVADMASLTSSRPHPHCRRCTRQCYLRQALPMGMPTCLTSVAAQVCHARPHFCAHPLCRP